MKRKRITPLIILDFFLNLQEINFILTSNTSLQEVVEDFMSKTDACKEQNGTASKSFG